jgi:hypothetical protein
MAGCQLLIQSRKLQPKVPIVFARAPETESEPVADVTVDTAEDPFAIISVLDKLLGRASSGQP